jgi:hypothetical protein
MKGKICTEEEIIKQKGSRASRFEKFSAYQNCKK